MFSQNSAGLYERWIDCIKDEPLVLQIKGVLKIKKSKNYNAT